MPLTRANRLRTVRLTPYRKGLGPTFTLVTWDSGRRDHRGTTTIGYELRQRDDKTTSILFSGEDFNASPMYADDSDKALAALLGFLTLRPGDTDRDYFDAYTPAQLEYCDQHAEALSCEAVSRFGEN